VPTAELGIVDRISFRLEKIIEFAGTGKNIGGRAFHRAYLGFIETGIQVKSKR